MVPARHKKVNMKKKITSQADISTLKVFIDGCLHVCIFKKTLGGFQSYFQDGQHYIELWVNGKRQLLIYEKEEVWKAVLNSLNQII